MSQSSVKMDMAVQKNIKNWWIKFSALNMFNAKEKGFSQYAKTYTSHYVDYRQPTVSWQYPIRSILPNQNTREIWPDKVK